MPRAKKAALPPPPPLTGLRIAFSGTFLGKTQAAVKAIAEAAGAVVASSVVADTTHLVTTETDYKKNSAKVAKAKTLNIPIVNLDWLEQSAQNGSRDAEKGYAFDSSSQDDDGEDDKNTAASNSNSQNTTNGKAARKRATPATAASDDEAAPKTKKTKGGKSADDDGDVKMQDDEEEAKVSKKKAKSKKEASPEAVMGEGQILKRKDTQIPVDEHCPHGNYQVYIDGSGVIYDASLNQTNSSKNNNKFYRIQLLVNNGQYMTWTRWGRVGDKGQMAVLGQGSHDGAMSQYLKKFKDKSGLDWDSRGDPPKPGKYAFVERSYNVESDDEEDDDKEDDDEAEDKLEKAAGWTPPKCTLHPAVQDLMALIFNQQFFAATMTSFKYDAKKLPLGKLSKATITGGFQALKDLAALLDDHSLASNYGKPYHEAVELLSNAFYSLIPHSFGRNRPPIINTTPMLKTEVELLESLSDMKDAALIMKLDKAGDDDIHPLDKQFQGLNLNEMDPLDPKSSEYSLLADYLMETRGATHGVNYKIEAIFRIERQGELDRLRQSKFAEPTANRRLLWHGSRATNFGGILSQGLRIAPKEVPSQGFMFDKGIYLADMSSKSANYCYHHMSDRTALLLLCEAELGDPMQELVNASYNAATTARANGMHSTWGKGNTGPLKWKDASCVHPNLAGVYMPDTLVKPGPTNVAGAGLYYNEYIAYDVAQVALRYLFRVKM
ncbi:poly-ribose polymerase [Rhypophila sp. PSN 637]